MSGCATYSSSSEGTKRIAEAIGRLLEPRSYICLHGELGAGKTTFVQGLAAGLGVPDKYITSPSFALINVYAGRMPFYHADLYRLSGPEDLEETGFLELPGEGAAAVEWPERAGAMLPADRLDITIEYEEEGGRSLVFAAHGIGYDRIMEDICRTTRW